MSRNKILKREMRKRNSEVRSQKSQVGVFDAAGTFSDKSGKLINICRPTSLGSGF